MWQRLRFSKRWEVLGEAGIIFLVALVPRLVGIGLFVTADEKNWVGRGANFLQAVQEFQFNETLQTTHPGIPTLWIAGISARLIARLQDTPLTGESLQLFIRGTQVPFALLNSALVGALFLALRFLARPWPARIAALAVALDPFLIGYSKVVHVDALLAGFTAVSLMLFLGATRERDELSDDASPLGTLAWSGITGALAILSKLPGLILIPLAALTLFGSRRAWASGERRARTRALGQWITIMAATIVLLWPGLLWVPDPVGNVKIVKRDLAVAISTPHHMADAYSISPWQYPKTILARTTIPALIGFAVFLLMFLLMRKATRAHFGGVSRRTLGLLLAFIALFTVAMTFGAKKGDRYLLPVFPILDLLGVIGLFALVSRLRPRWTEARVAMPILVLVAVPLVTELFLIGPYALAYYNRLFPPNFSQELGWGEGLDQVAGYLNRVDDRDKAAVASWYPEELNALVRRPVFHINAREQLRVGYVVLYRNMFGRPADHPANDFIDEYYRRRTPVFTAMVNGLPYAWVYQQPTYTEVVGELTEESLVVAEVPTFSGTFRGVEALVATYFGKADTGTLVLQLLRATDGVEVRVSRVPVHGAADNQWLRFPFEPLIVQDRETFIAVLTAEGTRVGNAPTLRWAPQQNAGSRFGVGKRGDDLRDILNQHRSSGLFGLRPIRE